MPGDMVQATQGHDAGRCYLVLDHIQERFALVDGRKRPYHRPKWKNSRHLCILKKCAMTSDERAEMQACHPASGQADRMIRERISAWKKGLRWQEKT